MATDPREVIPESLTMGDKAQFSSCPSLEGLCFASYGVENVYMSVWCAPIQRTLDRLNGLNLILNFHWNLRYQNLACENIRFFSLFAAEDVSREGTSATQRENSILMT